jgi:hypothetical protein
VRNKSIGSSMCPSAETTSSLCDMMAASSRRSRDRWPGPERYFAAYANRVRNLIQPVGTVQRVRMTRVDRHARKEQEP